MSWIRMPSIVPDLDRADPRISSLTPILKEDFEPTSRIGAGEIRYGVIRTRAQAFVWRTGRNGPSWNRAGQP